MTETDSFASCVWDCLHKDDYNIFEKSQDTKRAMVLLLVVRLLPLTEIFPFDLLSHWSLGSSPTFLVKISAPLVLEKMSKQSFRVLKDFSGCPILNTFDYHNSTNQTVCQCQSVYGFNFNETITVRHFSRSFLPV